MPHMSMSILLWGLLFGSIGLGFFTYGKKQKAVVPLLSGVGLMVFPYFITNTYFMIIAGALLIAIPWFVRI